ncbi:hypothetical protein SO694_0003617 [Aureococcus anophagefferens]|uniref:Uncharacterized protein n=1 Tax=Aureococcus anophagefferens TaxID=44056 RepID=A0ABR1FL78_AURAN
MVDDGCVYVEPKGDETRAAAASFDVAFLKDEVKRLRPKLGRTTNELHDTENELKAEENELHKAEENGGVNALDAMAEAMDEMGGDEEGFIGKKVDRLYEKADESYFFRVQTMIMYNGFSPTTCVHFFFSMAIAGLQVMAMQTLDEFKAGYVLIRRIGRDLVASIFSPPPVVDATDGDDDDGGGEGGGAAGRSARATAATSHISVLSEAKDGEEAMPIGRLDMSVRLFCCLCTYYVRGSLLWYFVDVSAQVLGTADGPFNMLLNAVALVYILDIDDMLSVDMPSNNFFGIDDPELLKRDRDDGKSWIAYAKGGLAFVVDGMILIIIRHLGVRYAISSLLTYNLSWETPAARFWDRAEPRA